jgi:hypothetical protein
MMLRKIETYQGSPVTRLAMKLLAPTFVRTSELIGRDGKSSTLRRSDGQFRQSA